VSADSVSSGRRTFRLVLEYDGLNFEGWQVQAGERPSRTVQGVLTEALESVTGSRARVRGAGRTDAGVHAYGQVASVQVSTQFTPEQLARALNGRLCRDIAVREIDAVPLDWDALREARGKHYRYQIWNGADRSPLRAGRFHWLRDPLDVGRMREASEIFVGTHDFAALQGAGSEVKTTVRTIQVVGIKGEAGSEIILDVEGEGFLRHMVRNLAGTLIEIGRGRWEVARGTEILASLDRQQAGPTAPANGLVLIEVRDSWSLADTEAANRPLVASRLTRAAPLGKQSRS
jgi:tRNA pseudouridine38-40 synthase